jgi:hypothetical protein
MCGCVCLSVCLSVYVLVCLSVCNVCVCVCVFFCLFVFFLMLMVGLFMHSQIRIHPLIHRSILVAARDWNGSLRLQVEDAGQHSEWDVERIATVDGQVLARRQLGAMPTAERCGEAT